MRVRSLFDLSFLERYAEHGPLAIRLMLGWHLIYGTQDNVFDFERMMEFREFLAQNHFPFPTFNAFLSAYAQFICGSLYILGLFTRHAAAVMVINFIVALVMVHRANRVPGMRSPS